MTAALARAEIARVTISQVSMDPHSTAINRAQYVRAQLLQHFRERQGFKNWYTLLDRDSGKSMSIIVWESEAAMRASEDLIESAQSALASQRGLQVLEVQYLEFTVLA